MGEDCPGLRKNGILNMIGNYGKILLKQREGYRYPNLGPGYLSVNSGIYLNQIIWYS